MQATVPGAAKNDNGQFVEVIAYSASPAFKVIIIDKIVTIIDEPDCGLTICSIMAKGCITEL
jgi:hypothetical protein